MNIVLRSVCVISSKLYYKIVYLSIIVTYRMFITGQMVVIMCKFYKFLTNYGGIVCRRSNYNLKINKLYCRKKFKKYHLLASHLIISILI